MSIIGIIILSTTSSFIIDKLNQAYMHKDLADSGYKLVKDIELRTNGLKKYKDQIGNLIYLVPGLNLVGAFYDGYEYSELKEEIFEELEEKQAIKPMNELELKEYNKSRTILNAMIYEERVESILRDAYCIRIYDGKNLSYIYYEIEDTGIKILYTTITESMTIEEQKALVIKLLSDKYNELISQDISKQNLVKELKSINIINIDENAIIEEDSKVKKIIRKK